MGDRALTSTARCRSCGAQIEWTLTAKGRRMPLDVDERADGNLVVDDAHRAVSVPAGTGNRTSHFATCPNAGEHRTRGRR